MTMTARPTILVAEDDIAAVLLLQTAAAEADLRSELRFVEDGQALLEDLETAPSAHHPMPYLVLLDLRMPRMTGREALRRLRERPTTRTLPVVILSSTDARDEIHACLVEGANAFIVKPVGVPALVAMLRRVEAFWLDTASGAPSR